MRVQKEQPSRVSPWRSSPACASAKPAEVSGIGRSKASPPCQRSWPLRPTRSRPKKSVWGRPSFMRDDSPQTLVSCWRCHPISLYAADGLKTSVGNSCKVGPRNAPTVFNAAGQIAEHWIGIRRDVEEQAALAVTAPGSFNMPSDDAVEKRWKRSRDMPSFSGTPSRERPGPSRSPISAGHRRVRTHLGDAVPFRRLSQGRR